MKKLFIIPLAIMSASMSFSCNKTADFATASWDDVINYANKGETEFKKKFGFNDVNDVVGKTRTLKLGGYAEFPVRVIGVNHDKLKDQESKALLTFEFAKCVTYTIFNNDKNSNGVYEYEYGDDKTSLTRDFIDNEFILYFPQVIQDNFKTVEKTSWQRYDGETQGIIKTHNKKLFLLSCTEIGYEKTDVTNTEGNTYKYYESTSKTGEDSKRLKQFSNQGCEYYWLRSESSTYADNAFVVSKFGKPFTDKAHNIHCIAPAFCL